MPNQTVSARGKNIRNTLLDWLCEKRKACNLVQYDKRIADFLVSPIQQANRTQRGQLLEPRLASPTPDAKLLSCS